MAKNRIGTNPLDSLIPDPQDSKKAKRKDGKTVKRNDSKTASEAEGEARKVKVTLYLPADVETALESAWVHLRRLTGRKVSKSDVAAAALRALADDVEQKGDRSVYAKQLR